MGEACTIQVDDLSSGPRPTGKARHIGANVSSLSGPLQETLEGH